MSLIDLITGAGGFGLLSRAYDDLSDLGKDAMGLGTDLAEEQLEQTRFQPYTIKTATGGRFTAGPDGSYQMDLTPREQSIQNQLFGQANQMLGQPVIGQDQLNQAGTGAIGVGLGLMNQPVFGTAPTQAASQQAFGMGNQFMQSAQQQPADLNLLRGQFAGQVSGLLGQQPSAGIGQLGDQALSLGMQGLDTQAPQDVEALRSQYGGLAGQAASNLLQPTEQREADVYERIRATQRPGEERQRLELEQRLAAQGRLGTSSAAYGGATPEQLALSTAQEEARNRASLSAIQQAQSERAQSLGEAQTLGGMFGQQAGLSSQLQGQAQQRAAQLSQLGLSANQIQSQLQSEGLGRAATAAGQAGQLAQLAGGLQAQQAGLGAQYAGLGANLAGQAQGLSAAQQAQALQAMQAGQGLLGGAQGLQIGQQQLGLGALAGAYMPQQQLLPALSAGQTAAAQQQQAQMYGAGLFGEAKASGLDMLLSSYLGRANLAGSLGGGLLSRALPGILDDIVSI